MNELRYRLAKTLIESHGYPNETSPDVTPQDWLDDIDAILAEIEAAGCAIVATDRLERLVAAAVLGNDWYTNGVSSRSGNFVLPVRSPNVFDALQPGDLDRPREEEQQ